MGKIDTYFVGGMSFLFFNVNYSLSQSLTGISLTPNIFFIYSDEVKISMIDEKPSRSKEVKKGHFTFTYILAVD